MSILALSILLVLLLLSIVDDTFWERANLLTKITGLSVAFTCWIILLAEAIYG